MPPNFEEIFAELQARPQEKAVPNNLWVAANDPAWVKAACSQLEGHSYTVQPAAISPALLKSLTPDCRHIVLCRPEHQPADLKICRQIHELSESAPVYLVAAVDRECLADPKCALLSLADDFLLTPFHKGELINRMEVAMRHLRQRAEFGQREAQMHGLRADLEEQNRLLDDAMTYLTGANNRFAELFEGIPAACYCIDDQGRIHEWNRAAAEMYGYQAHEVISRYIWDIFAGNTQGKEQYARRSKDMVRRLVAGECLHGKEVEVACKDDRILHVLRNSITITTADQKTRSVMIADIDITERRELERQVLEQLRTLTELNAELENGQKELARANAKLERLAATDGLTGLRNRRYFQDTVGRQFSFAARHYLPLSLIMIDVDRFKSYNDCFGHPAGDELLKILAQLLEHGVRNHDCIARYGGEEFVVLLPSTDAVGSKEVAERLRHTVEAHEWLLRLVTISVGAATFVPVESNYSPDAALDLIKAADKALYAAKANGRNRVEHYADLPVSARKTQAHGRGAKRAA